MLGDACLTKFWGSRPFQNPNRHLGTPLFFAYKIFKVLHWCFPKKMNPSNFEFKFHIFDFNFIMIMWAKKWYNLVVLHQYQHVAVVHVFFYPAKFSWQGVACFTNHGGSAIVSPRCYNSTSSLSLCGVLFSEQKPTKKQNKSKSQWWCCNSTKRLH